ncbi:Dot/Icm T4SS effector VpdC [Legionella jordanis]|uniref:Esterase of the alpha-beta hydrolase superfamily protein n=1 Tax=Legionella jordanis TaxID=456 RepID=A0A0W0V7S8_9GAMM|nr:Dot/Icm T4SS effector VpdC [Legionella jordanis]KTD16138.1 esterase of the alpha-beta hydrolase superfamily protein [Legionella jordanis]RMX04635.1 phospholipase [Legionella jordanis]VEH12402.1 esterase of the alpha-beta hydrolase superfamily [Legionella jordanis]HAT8713915.1 phospholipase [Legionella jordanis]
MSRKDVLNDLLSQDIVHHPNVLLLKKFLLCVHHGWFRINGQPPDSKFSLSDYLLDDERIIIDFTRMSEISRKKFLQWFLAPHREQAYTALLSGVTTNNYRGYTAEVGLSWWGRITNLLFYRRKSYHWHLAPLELSLNYQLTGLEICEDTHGLLIGFNQLAPGETGTKYREPQDNQTEPLRNTKRVILTDAMVEHLLTTDIQAQNFSSMVSNPHPFAVRVLCQSKRMQDMREYRQTQRLITTKSWLQRLFDRLKAWFTKPSNEIEMEEILGGSKDYRLLFKDQQAEIYRRETNGQILVIEKRQDVDSFVFCGGGAKIFAHVGGIKAFEEAGISADKFAGSSAGAIMAILCYIGCSSAEILEFFQGFKEENLIHYDIDSSGLSDARALKAALDYMIVKKVNGIIDKYSIDKTAEGRRFLAEHVFRFGKITFESLHKLKCKYPDCGLGKELIVTATHVERRETRYFSFPTTPWAEISEAGKTSASFPVIFKPTLLDGKPHKDGGILNNLPTETFKDDRTTLLESEHGNCLRMLAFQFDHGYERSLVDRLVERVYRENFFWNWIYGLLTGVKDPVSGWEKDRLKLLQHSNQVVLIPVGKISSTQFNLDMRDQNELVKNGYEAANHYIQARYDRTEEKAKNVELMFSTFSSLEELLYFSCYRGHAEWFERIAREAQQEGMSEEKIVELRRNYFTQAQNRHESPTDQDDFTSHLSSERTEKCWIFRNMRLFEAVYPIFHRLPSNFVNHANDVKLFKLARHFLSLNQPLFGLRYLNAVKGPTHILFHIFTQFLQSSHLAKIEDIAEKFKLLNRALQVNEYKIKSEVFWGNWNLLPRQGLRVINLILKENWEELQNLCASLKQGEEPLEVFSVLDTSIVEEEDDIYLDNRIIEGDRSRLSI